MADPVEKHFERDQIERMFRDWWYDEVRYGMGSWEAGASFMKALDSAGFKIVKK